MVEVFGSGFTGVNFIFDTVKTSHHQCGKAKVGIGHGIGETRFDATRFVGSHMGNADRRRAVAAGVSQLHRGFKAGHQTLVAVGGGVGDGVECTGVFDDAAYVEQSSVAQTCVAFAGKQVFAVFPKGLVNVHA